MSDNKIMFFVVLLFALGLAMASWADSWQFN